MAYTLRTPLFRTVLGLCIVSSPCRAQISLDGSLGGMSGDLAIGGNNEYTIGEELGKQMGSNLFHSFGDFNVNSGETATFTGMREIDNILSRVTGGNASNINGTLGTDFPNATPNLYLLNPAGILFGPDASLMNVQGSFHATTADYIGLADGTRFNALPSSADASLTTFPPAAFGFLGENPAGITVQGNLETAEGETLSVVSGSLQISAGTLAAPNGRIDIASVGSAGEVVPVEDDLNVESIDRFGEISITEQGKISTTGEGGGTIFIRGGQLVMNNNSSIEANSQGVEEDIGIDVKAESVSLIWGAVIEAITLSEGQGGNVLVEADSVSLSGKGADGFTGIAAQANPNSTGDAGDLTIKAGSVEVRDGAHISASTVGIGLGGDLRVSANVINLRDEGSIRARSTATDLDISNDPDAGRSGNIFINARDSLQLFNDSDISVETAQANAGSITLQVGQLIQLNEQSSITTSVAQGRGNGGNIVIDPIAVVLNGASGITANARQGRGGNISITTDSLFQSPDSVISASSDLGIDGEVDISSPETDLVSSTLSLPAAFLDATNLLSGRCTPRKAGRSSFIVAGRRAVPPGPETRLPGHVFEFPKTHAPRGSDPHGGLPYTLGRDKRSNLALLPGVIGCNSH